MTASTGLLPFYVSQLRSGLFCFPPPPAHHAVPLAPRRPTFPAPPAAVAAPLPLRLAVSRAWREAGREGRRGVLEDFKNRQKTGALLLWTFPIRHCCGVVWSNLQISRKHFAIPPLAHLPVAEWPSADVPVVQVLPAAAAASVRGLDGKHGALLACLRRARHRGAPVPHAHGAEHARVVPADAVPLGDADGEAVGPRAELLQVPEDLVLLRDHMDCRATLARVLCQGSTLEAIEAPVVHCE
mmetsp:Transcript_13714/g.39120  ORF Transcript_13714/g.39120 Transcript_13714/m.39120 type:complete len:241 (+) Transcript_13714:70-792(+)